LTAQAITVPSIESEQLAGALRVIHQAIDDLDRAANKLNRRIVRKAA